MTYASFPSIELKLPAGYLTVGKQFSIGIEQPAQAGVARQFLTEGPGSVLGQSVKFAANDTPLSLPAGKPFIFGFYAVSTNDTSASELLYVGYGNSVRAYPMNASGAATPVRTIAGSNTQLANGVSCSVT